MQNIAVLCDNRNKQGDMRQEDSVAHLVSGTADPAFAVNTEGIIVAWNRGAEEALGVSARRALGKRCGTLLCGTDEGGAVCVEDCIVQQSLRSRRPVRGFDLQLRTRKGKRWFSCSLIITGSEENHPVAVYVLRSSDSQKRLEQAVRHYVESASGPEPRKLRAGHMLAVQSRLTRRQMEVLKLMAGGVTTARIAAHLRVSRFTVNNHIQQILRRLGAHTRLEAVRRAEAAGLL